MFTYSHARNPKWVNAAMTAIELEVNFDHLPENEYDPCALRDLNGVPGEEHIADLWNRTIAGDFGPISAFVTPADWDANETMLRFHVRPRRDLLLQRSDHAVANDRWMSMSEEKRQEWATYRQTLRDVPQSWTITSSYDIETDQYHLNTPYEFPEEPA